MLAEQFAPTTFLWRSLSSVGRAIKGNGKVCDPFHRRGAGGGEIVVHPRKGQEERCTLHASRGLPSTSELRTPVPLGPGRSGFGAVFFLFVFLFSSATWRRAHVGRVSRKLRTLALYFGHGPRSHLVPSGPPTLDECLARFRRRGARRESGRSVFSFCACVLLTVKMVGVTTLLGFDRVPVESNSYSSNYIEDVEKQQFYDTIDLTKDKKIWHEVKRNKNNKEQLKNHSGRFVAIYQRKMLCNGSMNKFSLFFYKIKTVFKI